MNDELHRIGAPAWRVLMALAIAVALPCACGRKEPGTDGAKAAVVRVAILADDGVDPMRNYQLTLLANLVRTRARMEISTVHAGGDVAVQARQVREAAQAGAAFLMVFPQDAEKLAPALREAVAGGARVFVFSPDVPEDACTGAIFTDDRKLGQIAGEYVVSALKMKAQEEGQPAAMGRVVMLRGDDDSVACQRRAEAFLSALQPYPGIVLVHDAPADWSEKSSGERAREALRLQKQFDVIYAQNDLMAAGASKAVRESSVEARDSMLILGTDGVPGKGTGVAMVIGGEIDATVYQPPLVDVAWREMQSLLDTPDTAMPRRIAVKPFMITPENAASIQRDGLPEPDTK